MVSLRKKRVVVVKLPAMEIHIHVVWRVVGLGVLGANLALFDGCKDNSIQQLQWDPYDTTTEKPIVNKNPYINSYKKPHKQN